MATDLHPPDERHSEPIDYAAAEGLTDEHHVSAPADEQRDWLAVGLGLTALVAVIAVIIAVIAFATSSGDENGVATAATPAAPAAPAAGAEEASAPTLEQAKGVDFEPFERVDPTLPAPVTKVEVDVYHHVTQVSKDLAPTEVWSYKVNGVEHRGTGVSAPIVVEEGTVVDFKLTNGTDESMAVDLPHSLDYHSAEVDPGRRYRDLAPGESLSYKFEAAHPGVFMYHCATEPVLMHTGAGMVGMMVVKPKGLPAVDRELWITQQEYYIGRPGGDADMAKMAAKEPDVIAFNGYANQYADHPIQVKKGERIRMYVLNAGPSTWSAFHVIGTVFDRAVTDNGRMTHVQTINLAPSQGGFVEFTLEEEGTYPFVNHAFGDMVKGASGVLVTENAPKGSGHGGHGGHGGGDTAAAGGQQAAAADADVRATLGDMWVKTDKPSVKAGEVTFAVENTGATMHGLAIVKAPAKVDGGTVDESTFVAKGADLKPGEAETITAKLEPGEYELICFVPGHYMAGQKLPFEVTS